jgi:hypothetical protein
MRLALHWGDAAGRPASPGASRMSLRLPLAAQLFARCKSTKQARRKSRPRHNVALGGASFLLEERRMLALDSLAVWDAQYYEAGESIVFWITRSGECVDPISATYATSDGTAAAGEDYVAQTGVISFTDGNTLVPVTIALLDDTLTEESETFFLDLIEANDAVFDRASATGTITPNDHPPELETMETQTAVEHSWFSFTPVVTDIDDPAETFTYSLEGAIPEGAAIDSETGEFTWTPGEEDGDKTFMVTIVVTDSGAKSTSAVLTIDVLEQNEQPTTSGFGFVTFDEDTISAPIDLYAAFDDVEDSDAELSYSIDGVDSSLVKSVNIDSAGQLTIEGAENAFGSGSITIRATDSGGLWEEAVLSFEILPVNDAPIIALAVTFIDGEWELSGTVSDVDDEVVGDIVTFGGELGAYFSDVEVQEDGTFVIRTTLPENSSGTVTAQTEDGQGLASNIAEGLIFA